MMLKKSLFLLAFSLLLLSVTVNSQKDSNGIIFSDFKSWNQVLELARTENKYIFIDCFATWCGPCKQMDQQVYSSPKVGAFAGKNFLSFRVQLDSTKSDDAITKRMYEFADSLKKQLNIFSLPTYLFFSPSGNIVHRDMGFKNAKEFLQLLNDAQSTDKQVYTLLQKYHNSKLSYDRMIYLANQVKNILFDQNTANQIAQHYKKAFLNKLSISDLLTEANIAFVMSFPKILNSEDNFFIAIYNNISYVDSVMNEKGYAKRTIERIIYNEEVVKHFKASKKGKIPNWKKLSSTIRKKYNQEYADQIELNAKIAWYRNEKKWDSVIHLNVYKIEKYGVDTTFWGKFNTNNMIYGLFLGKCADTTILKKAARWMEVIISVDSGDADFIDTYANLLYKLGRYNDAVAWEEKALSLSPTDEEIIANLSKMKKKTLTWD